MVLDIFYKLSCYILPVRRNQSFQITHWALGNESQWIWSFESVYHRLNLIAQFRHALLLFHSSNSAVAIRLLVPYGFAIPALLTVLYKCTPWLFCKNIVVDTFGSAISSIHVVPFYQHQLTTNTCGEKGNSTGTLITLRRQLNYHSHHKQKWAQGQLDDLFSPLSVSSVLCSVSEGKSISVFTHCTVLSIFILLMPEQ